MGLEQKSPCKGAFSHRLKGHGAWVRRRFVRLIKALCHVLEIRIDHIITAFLFTFTSTSSLRTCR